MAWPSGFVLALSLAVVLLVLFIALGSRSKAPPLLPAASEFWPLALEEGRCGVSAEAFVAVMPEYHQRQYGVLRRYTQHGAAVTRLPLDLKAALVAEYRRRRPQGTTEKEVHFISYGDEAQRPTLVWLSGSAALAQLQAHLAETLSRWAACGPLEHTATYGAREYHRGAKLQQHVDRPHTHAISAIVNIAADGLEREWPVHVLPHGAEEVCAVALRDYGGDVLLYESATVPHGRLEALQGDSYANVFLHYRPKGWLEHARQVLGAPA